jgi:transposase
VQSEDPRDRRIAELMALVERLAARVAELEAELARLKRNSTNSSKPPSSDPPAVTRPTRAPTGKKRGGQPGHQGHQRELLPIEQVDNVVPLVPERCGCCGKSGCLMPAATPPVRSQVIEIPPIKPNVTERQQFSATCLSCGATTLAPLPSGMPRGAFGPRLAAMLAVCTAKYRLSKRAVREMLSDFLGVELCLGSVANVEKQVSAALAAPTEEARAHVKASKIAHADETSWRESKRKAWLWVAATPSVAIFLVAARRNAKVAKELLGEAFAGILVTDRYSAYRWVKTALRQLCWAHLRRDFQSWVDSGGDGAHFGQALLGQARRMFKWWHKVRDGTLAPEVFQKRMRTLQINVGATLSTAEECGDKRVAGMAKEILKLEPALWTFVETPGVEPTNNFAERTIRHAVLWRKGSFGTDSAEGSRFVERMLTTVATLRLQRRNVLEFITQACEAQLRHAPPPSLLPQVDLAVPV